MKNIKAGDLVRVLPGAWAVEQGMIIGGEVVEVVTLSEESGDITVNSHNKEGITLTSSEYVLYQAIERQKPDMIRHPAHYTSGKFETIEMIEAITAGYGDGYLAYCVGNAIKYLARAPFKHETPLEDLQKAKTYLEFAIERIKEPA